jgi:hypothetical protein
MKYLKLKEQLGGADEQCIGSTNHNRIYTSCSVKYQYKDKGTCKKKDNNK